MALREQRALEAGRAVERGAVRERAGGRDRRVGVPVEALLREDVGVLDDADLVGLFLGLHALPEVVGVAPAAEVVEVLQAEADRVDAAVAGAARGVAGVHLQLLPEAEPAQVAELLRQDPRARRGRRRRVAEQHVEHVVAALDRAGVLVVRRQGQDAAVAQVAAAVRVVEPHAAHVIALDALHAVERGGELLVDEGVVGVDEPPDRLVAANERQEEQRRLVAHRGHQRVGAPRVVDRVEPDPGADVLEAEPLGREAGAEGVGLRVVEHPVDLRFEHRRVAQRAAAGEAAQLGVRHRGPEEIGEARGEVPVADAVRPGSVGRRRRLDAQQEPRRDQHRLQHHLHRVLERLARPPRRAVAVEGPGDVPGAGRAPPGAFQEPAEHLFGRLLAGEAVAGRGDEHQLARAPLGLGRRLRREHQLHDPLGRRDVALHQRGFEEQRVRRVVEPARAGELGREAVGQGEVRAEQVAQRVVELAVRQPLQRLVARVVDGGVVEAVDGVGQQRVERLALGAGRPRRAGGRHLADLQGVQHAGPGLAVAHQGALGDQRVEVDAGGLGPRAVAAEAVPRQQRGSRVPVRGGAFPGGRLRGRAPGAGRGGQDECERGGAAEAAEEDGHALVPGCGTPER